MFKLKFITGNYGKFEEFKNILDDLVELEMVDIDLPEIQGTPLEIIQNKVQVASTQLNGPFVVEDSSLTFNAWNGLPGPYIKWYLKSVGNKGMVKMLDSFEDKGATASCYIGLYKGKNKSEYFLGEIKGEIKKPMGENGFGWDKIFSPKGYDITFGEFEQSDKNKISHRRLAIDKLRNYMESLIGSKE